MENQTPVIIDTDVAIDDWMALFHLLSNPAGGAVLQQSWPAARR